jgi:hypothetical protein
MAKPRARLTDDNDPLSSTESVFASLEQVSKSASQQADNTTIKEVTSPVLEREAIVITTVQADKSSSQQSDKLESQKVRKSTIRKSTFQLSEEVLKQLDRYHLQLQLELGKAIAPYKEVIVEEAIAQFLANADQKFVDEILKRQKTR